MNRDRIVLERRTVSGGQAGRENGTWSNVRWISSIELRQTWPSYLISALLTPLIGLLAMTLFWSGLESVSNVDGVPAEFLSDFFFLLVLVNLSINWTSLRWFYVYRDPFTSWLTFLKTLPVSTRELVLGRLAIMLATTAVTAPLFFLPTYALFPALRAEISPTQYLWFALLWVGYALFSGGVLLYLEMGVGGRATFIILIAWSTLLVSTAVLAAVLGVSLTVGSLGLVRDHGPLVVIPAFAVGGGGLFLWCRLLERRLKAREFPA